MNLTTGVTGGGNIVRDPDQFLYDIGTVVNLTAIPDTGFVFQDWTGPVADPLSETTTVLMKSNTLVGATFVPSTKPQLKVDLESGASLDFGIVETGLLSTSATRTITVTNLGGGTLDGTAALTESARGQFEVIVGGSFSLATEQSTEIQLVFRPLNTDNLVDINGVLSITSNGGNREILLNGQAIKSGELACSGSTPSSGVAPWGDGLLLLVVIVALALAHRHPRAEGRLARIRE